MEKIIARYGWLKTSIILIIIGVIFLAYSIFSTMQIARIYTAKKPPQSPAQQPSEIKQNINIFPSISP